MAIYHNGNKIISLYHKGKKIDSVYHNGIKIYSSLLPVGTSVFNDTNFVIDKDNVSGSVGGMYPYNSMSGDVYKAITLEYPLSKYKNGVEIKFNRSVAAYETGDDAGWYNLYPNNGNLSIKIPKSSSEVSYYLDIDNGENEDQGSITISINGQKLTMTNLAPKNELLIYYPIIASITAY